MRRLNALDEHAGYLAYLVLWIVLDQLTHAIDEAGEVLAAQFAHGIEEHKLGPVLTVGESLGGDSAVLHTDISLKVGETLKVKPSYDYDPKITDFKARPRLYPSHLLYDVGDKSMITIYNVGKGNAEYKGGIIDGAAVIKATKAGTTTIVFRSPNGRTLIGDVTITK